MPLKNGQIAKRQMKQLPETLCKQTHFSKSEVASLLQQFYNINNGKMKMDRSTFRNTFHQIFDITGDVILDRIFREFDQDSDGAVSLLEWVYGMSLFLRGFVEEKTKFCFSIYNIKNDGYINREQAMNWLKHAIPKSSDEDPEEGIRDLCDIVLKMMDKDQDGYISFADFEKAIQEEEILMECLGTIFPEQRINHEFMCKMHTEKDVV